MQFLTDKLTVFPYHSEDHKIHKLSQTPLSFHRLSRPCNAYPFFTTFKDCETLDNHTLSDWTNPPLRNPVQSNAVRLDKSTIAKPCTIKRCPIGQIHHCETLYNQTLSDWTNLPFCQQLFHANVGMMSSQPKAGWSFAEMLISTFQN